MCLARLACSRAQAGMVCTSSVKTCYCIMRVCLLLMILTHHTLKCVSSGLPEEVEEKVSNATPSEHPSTSNASLNHSVACLSGFLEYIVHHGMSGEGEAPVVSELDMERPEEEDDVLSFAEYKQRMSQLGVKTRIRPSSSKVVTRNYASLECGAKVIETNPNARNPSAILNSNKDQYLINDCSSPIFFIVELCELVSVRTIVIASLELFSSIPKSFKVFASERWKTDSQTDVDWLCVGTFVAANERSEQSFPLSNDEQVYAKYIKVVMESHYGQERLCPLNTFKVIGASMIEVYEEFQQDVGVSSSPSVIPGPESEGNGEEDSLLDAPGDAKDSDYNGTLLGAAKDAVLRMLEQPLEILGTMIKPDGKSSPGDHDNQAEETPELAQLEASPPPEEAEKEESKEALEEVIEKDGGSGDQVKENENGKELISPETTLAGAETKEEADLPPFNSSLTSLDSEGEALSETVLESDEFKVQMESVQDTSILLDSKKEVVKNSVVAPPTPNDSGDSPSTSEEPHPLNEAATEDASPSPLVPSVSEDPSPETEPLGPTDVGNYPTREGDFPSDMEPLGPTSAPDTGESPDLEEEPPLGAPATEHSPLTSIESSDNSMNGFTTHSDPTPVPSHTSSSTAGAVTATHNSSTDRLSVPSLNDTHSSVTANRSTGTLLPTPLKSSLNGSLNATNGTVGNKGGKNESETNVTNGNGVHAAPRDKEKSVFLRLSNQIKDLEMNMSLFSSYLDQISAGLKRNKNKTEDTTKTLEKKLSALNSTLQLLGNETEFKTKLLEGLSGELQTLMKAVVNTTVELAAVDDTILLAIILLAGLQGLIFTPLFFCCCLLQAHYHRKLQKDLESLQTTIKLLGQQSASCNGARFSHFKHRHQHHRANSDIGVTHSLPLLPQEEGLTSPTGCDNLDWRVCDGKHRKRNKLKIKG